MKILLLCLGFYKFYDRNLCSGPYKVRSVLPVTSLDSILMTLLTQYRFLTRLKIGPKKSTATTWFFLFLLLSVGFVLSREYKTKYEQKVYTTF